jgi:hypothetical protein
VQMEEGSHGEGAGRGVADGEPIEGSGGGEEGRHEADGVASIPETEGRPLLSADELSARTVPQLKELLRAAGLKVGCRKAELIERLLGRSTST